MMIRSSNSQAKRKNQRLNLLEQRAEMSQKVNPRPLDPDFQSLLLSQRKNLHRVVRPLLDHRKPPQLLAQQRLVDRIELCTRILTR